MKHFKNIQTLEELKKRYKQLAMVFHPDKGGSTAIMQEVNNEYDKMFTLLKDKANKTEATKTTETPEEYKNIVNILVNLVGIEVEICGAWLWISGDTKQHKDTLKRGGCYWASKKEMWYWRPADQKVKGKSNMSIDDIRAKYGSEKINSRRQYAIA